MSKPKLIGSITPRLYHPPLRELTPETSRGFAFIKWCHKNLSITLTPHLQFLAIHLLELNEDNETYRWLTAIVMMGRQSAKTTFGICLTLWRMCTEPGILVLGTSVTLDMALETWQLTIDLANRSPAIAGDFNKPLYTTGRQSWSHINGSRYAVKAANDNIRGWSCGLLILDELKKHKTWNCWQAASKTTVAQPLGMRLLLSNAGDDDSVVLNSLRATALAGTDPATGIWEWSAPDGADILDRTAWQAAKPLLGIRTTEASILSSALTDPNDVFRTEDLCQRVKNLQSLVEAAVWRDLADADVDLSEYKKRVAVGLDTSPDSASTVAVAAAIDDTDRARVVVIGSWATTNEARAALPDLLDSIRPRAIHVPPGPAVAAFKADLSKRRGWRVLTVAETAEACGSYIDHIASRRLIHSDEAILTSHTLGAQKLPAGDGYRFTRAGGHVSASYAAAVAVRAARQAPPAIKLEIIHPRAS